MKYDFDNLHIEIDNAAAELGLSPWDALEIWHMGIEVWQSSTQPTDRPDHENKAACVECGRIVDSPQCKAFHAGFRGRSS